MPSLRALADSKAPLLLSASMTSCLGISAYYHDSAAALVVDGEIVAANAELADNPSAINEDPEGKAWLYKLKVSDADQLSGLMDAGAYKTMIG